MDKDIQEIRKRAGLLEDNEPIISTQDQAKLYGGYQEGEPNILTNKDKRYLAGKVLKIQKKHKDWRSLNQAIVGMMMAEMERMYDTGFQDGRFDTNVNEVFGIGKKLTPEDYLRLRKAYKIPKNIEDKDIMKYINQQKYSSDQNLRTAFDYGQ